MGQLSDFIWKHYPERAQAKGIPKSTLFQLHSRNHSSILVCSLGTPANGYPQEGTYFPDNTKSKEVLGLNYKSFESMLKDQLEQFVALEKELGAQ